jgi:hypothetical protein
MLSRLLSALAQSEHCAAQLKQQEILNRLRSVKGVRLDQPTWRGTGHRKQPGGKTYLTHFATISANRYLLV